MRLNPAAPLNVPRRPGRSQPGVVVVGVGRVGSVLGTALREAGHEVAGLHREQLESRSAWHSAGSGPDSPKRPDLPLRAAIPLATRREARRADVVLLCVPDDVLPRVAQQLLGRGVIRSGQLVVHTSGLHGAAVLSAVRKVGAHPVAIHPAMTFTGSREDVRRLALTQFTVTCDEQHHEAAGVLVADLGGTATVLPEGARPLYHAALAHGANHLVTVINDALELLEEAGVPDPARTLAPLVRAATENALQRGDEALTGPVSRGDVQTVATHLDHLAERSPAILPTYAALARRTAARATAAGRLAIDKAGPVLDVLAGRAGLRESRHGSAAR
jgi:predicted short-subunit dehydrogenase-like oxidoreductase (DUF2520 family)